MTSRKLTILVLGAGLALSLAACGQAPSGSDPRQASLSTSVPPSTDDSPNPSRPSPSPSQTGPSQAGAGEIGRDHAVRIALERTGGGRVDEVETEFEHGRTAWKVRVVNNGVRYSVYIDKANGEIIRFRDEGRH